MTSPGERAPSSPGPMPPRSPGLPVAADDDQGDGPAGPATGGSRSVGGVTRTAARVAAEGFTRAAELGRMAQRTPMTSFEARALLGMV